MERSDIYKKYNLDPKKIPQHVAIIMDGNGRWAKKRLLPRNAGHKAGSEALRATIKASVELGIKYLTLYVFSTENWKRPDEEVSFLMDLLKQLIIKEIPELNKNGARVRCLGAINELDTELQTKIKEAEEKTSNNETININLMINYGAKNEIINACHNICQDITNKKITDISEEIFTQYLYTKDSPEIDVFIRTGGDVRLSNYLLWQLAYSELFFIDTLWPDFDKKELIKIIQIFQKRERRFGGLN
jgi:undecaprenyl diphosphate synthase